jgi:hypothetical protein
MENLDDQRRVERAAKRVKALKGFYQHLAIYLIVNSVLLIIKARDLEPHEALFTSSTFSTQIFWGLGLGIHAFGTFGTSAVFGTDWEERKIRELMDKDKDGSEGWE